MNFQLEHRFGRVRVGLTGVPPSQLAAPLDLRADLSGGSLTTPGGLNGRVYLRLDYADLAAWANWLPLPVTVDRGEGALRMWVDVRASQPARVVADLEVNDLQTTLDPALTPLALTHLSGRATWAQNGAERSFRVDHLGLTLPDGVMMTSGHIEAVHDGGAAGGAAHGRITFDRVALAPLAEISAHLPLPARWHDIITALDPHGLLTDAKFDWSGDSAAPEAFAGSVRFADLSAAAGGGWPGVERLNGKLEADQDHGTLIVDGSHAAIVLPTLFEHPIALDSMRGRIDWDRRNNPLRITFDGFDFANADAAGTVSGTWQDDGTALGHARISARLTRANLPTVWHYVPESVPASVRAWLHRTLAAGSVTDATLALEGDLAEFPFRAGSSGMFTADATVRGVTLAYADGWPVATELGANLRFSGAGVAVDVSGGQSLGVQITGAHASVRDLGATDPLLSVTGAASGTSASFLDFVAKSPLAGATDHVAETMTASGDAHLALRFDLPLDTPAKISVDGTLSLDGNALHIGGAPAIDALSGDLRVTERGIDARALSGRVLGGPATFALSAHGDSVTLAATGLADLSHLRDAFAFAWLDRVGGHSPWTLDARLRDGNLEWTADATL
ncbi:MAG: YhdP family protein, partial [Casimicrobiaceae bacterium]